MQEIVRHADQGPIARVTLRDLVAPVFRHRRLVVISFLGIFFASVLAVFLLPKQYEAEMKILVKSERIDPTVTTNKATIIAPHSEVTEEQVQSEVELLQSRDLLETAAENTGLVEPDKAQNGNPSPVGVAVAVRTLQAGLRVEPLKKTNLIRATYRSKNPQLAARVLNTLGSLYLEKHLAVHRLPGAFDFFQKQTEHYLVELESNEVQLVGFSRDTGLVSPDLEKEITLRKEGEFEAALRETQANIAETSDRIHSLESQLSSTPPRVTTQERTSENPMLLQQLKSSLLTLQLKYTELTTKFAADYPPVKEVEKEIKQTETAIAAAEQSPFHESTTDSDPTFAWLREELAKDRAQLTSLRARASALTPVVEAYQAKTRHLNEEAATQQDLVRATKAAEENYLLYLQKQEEARISDALDQNRMLNVAIAEVATVPALPVHSVWYTLFLGIVLAVFVSLAAAFGSDYLDPSFRTPHELHTILQVQVLAAVPREVR